MPKTRAEKIETKRVKWDFNFVSTNRIHLKRAAKPLSSGLQLSAMNQAQLRHKRNSG